MKLYKKTIRGFTLLETLASIFILSVVIIGPLATIIGSSGSARLTKDTIIATYLAEESVELLQNQYDSLYIYCGKNASSTEVGGLCEPISTTETVSQTAWRVFKERLSGNSGQPTCYIPKLTTGIAEYVANSAGCSFDYYNMTASSTELLTRYQGHSSYCQELVPVMTTTFTGTTTSTSTSYVCNNSPLITTSNTINSKHFSRIIGIEQLSTFENPAVIPASLQYSDDLRVTSDVQFKGPNGVSHSIKITRFMHARP